MAHLYLNKTKTRIHVDGAIAVPITLRPFANTKPTRSYPVCHDVVRRLCDENSDLHVMPDVREALEAQADLNERCLAAAEDRSPGSFRPRSMPHQRGGARWLRTRRRGILADATGTGKTVTSLIATRSSDRVVVVCSNTKRPDWVQHAEDWGSGLVSRVVESNHLVDAVEPGECCVMGYEAARRHAGRIRGDVLILDEAHGLRNRHTALTQGIIRLARRFRNVYMLTATPVVNRPDDVWPLLHIADRFRFSSYWDFVCRFQMVEFGYFGVKVRGLRPPEETHYWALLNEYMLQRDKDASTLPDLVRRKTTHDLQGDQRRLYHDMMKHDVATFADERIEAVEAVAKITRLRQLALHPGLIWPSYGGPSKLDTLVDVLAEDPQATTVVFSMFSDLIALAAERLTTEGYRTAVITGEVSNHRREEQLRAFDRGEIDVLLVTHGTGGEGLNLVAARRAVMLDLAWHPAGNGQARDRIYRYGQTAESVEVIYIQSADTIEDHVLSILANKEPVTIANLARRLTLDG